MASPSTAASSTSASVPRGSGVSVLLLAALLTSGLVAVLTRSWGLTGLAVGVLFGFAMQRAAFCGSALLSSVVLLKDARGLIGVLIAIGVSMIGFGALAAAGRNYPLGTTESVMMVFSKATGGRVHIIGWMLWLGLGVILGSSVSAWQRGELRLRSADPATLLVGFAGGVLTGLGAVIGMGCFIGHVLSGFALLSFQSLTFGVVVLLANWMTTILYLRGW